MHLFSPNGFPVQGSTLPVTSKVLWQNTWTFLLLKLRQQTEWPATPKPQKSPEKYCHADIFISRSTKCMSSAPICQHPAYPQPFERKQINITMLSGGGSLSFHPIAGSQVSRASLKSGNTALCSEEWRPRPCPVYRRCRISAQTGWACCSAVSKPGVHACRHRALVLNLASAV